MEYELKLFKECIGAMFDKVRHIVMSNIHKFIYYTSNEPVFEIRGQFIEEAFVIFYIKTYTSTRCKGIATSVISFIKSEAYFPIYIFQVVSESLNNLCMKLELPKCNLTELFALSRDEVCTSWNNYTMDFGDYILSHGTYSDM